MEIDLDNLITCDCGIVLDVSIICTQNNGECYYGKINYSGICPLCKKEININK